MISTSLPTWATTAPNILLCASPGQYGPATIKKHQDLTVFPADIGLCRGRSRTGCWVATSSVDGAGRLHAGPEWYGFLLASAGAGAMAGAALAPSVLKGRRALTWALLTIGGCTVALGAGRFAIVALGLLFVIGLSSAVLNVGVMTRLQESTPAELRGRILAVTIAVASAAVPAGLGLGGLIGGLAGPALPWVLAGCGIGILVCVPFAPARR